MNIERKKNLLIIIFEVILVILVIIINIIPKNKDSVYFLPESNVIGVIGSSDGPTTIFLGREFHLINFTFPIFGLKFIGISVLVNIVLLTFIFIKDSKK
jgi:Na+-transporting methylmalonyl-CoA/oxaloacetate decarboxylase beta subunit